MVVGCRGVVIAKHLEKDLDLAKLDQNLGQIYFCEDWEWKLVWRGRLGCGNRL